MKLMAANAKNKFARSSIKENILAMDDIGEVYKDNIDKLRVNDR